MRENGTKDAVHSGVPSPRPSEDDEPRYAATLMHCFLIRDKIGSLHEKLRQSMEQLYICADREYRDGKLSMDDLVELYEQARTLGPGFTTVWNEFMSVQANLVQAYKRTRPQPNGPGGHSWVGVYPYQLTAVRPANWVPVVYVLYDAENEPIYVGSTKHFAARMSRHFKDGKPFVRWLAYPCDSREAAYLLEDGLLAARKPELNIKAGR